LKNWEEVIESPDGKKAHYIKKGNVRYFHLVAQPITQPILKDVSIEALGYNGSTPGPVIIIKQGEWIQLKVENQLDEPTALHVHGLVKPNSQDGVPAIEPTTPKIMPGESYTYQFIASQVGTYFYHSSMEHQTAQGLVGAFIVLPPDTIESVPDHDYVMFLQEWELPQGEMGKVIPGIFKPNKFDRNPNFFTINGKAFPNTSPIYTRYQDWVRIRFINKSSASHTMHLHGHDFKISAVDGFARNEYDDTVNVASGKRIELDFIASNPGIWPINGTKTFHQTNNGVSPGGMITRLVYRD
jgi:manganese oxidase